MTILCSYISKIHSLLSKNCFQNRCISPRSSNSQKITQDFLFLSPNLIAFFLCLKSISFKYDQEQIRTSRSSNRNMEKINIIRLGLGQEWKFTLPDGVSRTTNLTGLRNYPTNPEIALHSLPPNVFLLVVVVLLILLLLWSSAFGLVLPSKTQIQLYNTTKTPPSPSPPFP